MRRDLRILVLVLTIPLLLYGVGYAYAVQTTGSYANRTSILSIAAGSGESATIYCNSGDFATGGGFEGLGGLGPQLNFYNSRPNSVTQPTGWYVTVNNPTQSASAFRATVICQTPITVAGIGVPEFGTMYIVMLLGAAVFLFLTRMGKIQLKLVPVK